MRIYAITNQKGGVGKTTTALNLAAAATERGERTLIVDLDPHSGLTKSLGFDAKSFARTVYQVFLGEAGLGDVVQDTKIPGMQFVPANMDLSGIEVELIGELGWERVLKEALEPLRGRYDRVFLDCPPQHGVLTTNALVAADTVVVPLECEFLALQGLAELQQIIRKVKAKANPALEVRVLRTKYDGRTTHSQEVSEEIVKVFGAAVLGPIIQKTVKFPDSTVKGEPITTFAPSHAAAEAYRQVATEI